MRLPQGFFEWKKIIAIAVIVVPWFFKDQLAASLDRKAELARQALAEKNQQLELQDTAQDQREVLTRLRELQQSLDIVEAKADNANQADIDARLEKSNVELTSRYFEDEGNALAKSTQAFKQLLEKIDLAQPLKNELDQVAQQASATAVRLQEFGQKPDASQIDPLYAALDDAHNKLAEGYDKLEIAAKKERDDSDGSASIFRGVAWLCTGLGALLMGDWRKLLGGSDGGAGDEKTSETREEAAV